MDSTVKDLFQNFTQQVIGYLPNLLAGLVLAGIGWFLGWLAKRVVVQLCALLRLERLVQRFRWAEDLHKGDVRYALFDFIGNVAFFIVFLIFLNAALDSMKLTVLSNVIEKGVLFFPKFFVSLIILSVGWLVSSWVSVTIQKALLKEEIPRATLIARFTKGVMLLFFSAMALTELDVAREIVIIGFTATFITLGVLAIVLVTLGGKTFVKKVLKSLEEE